MSTGVLCGALYLIVEFDHQLFCLFVDKVIDPCSFPSDTQPTMVVSSENSWSCEALLNVEFEVQGAQGKGKEAPGDSCVSDYHIRHVVIKHDILWSAGELISGPCSHVTVNAS